MFKSTAGKTVRNLVLGSTALYAGGVALSLQNSAFNELFTDNVPFSEEAVDFIESFTRTTNKDYNIENLKRKFGGAEQTITIPKSGLISNKIESLKAEEEAPSTPSKLPITPSLIPEPVISKPSYSLPLISLSTSDKELQATIDEFNHIIAKLNAGDLTDSFSSSQIVESFEKLDAKVAGLKDSASKVFQEKVQEAATAQKNELLAQYIQQFNTKVKQVEQQHKDQLSKEIETTKAALEKHYENEAKLIAINAKKELSDVVEKTLTEERNGKYAKFDELDKSLSSLQKLILQMDSHIENAEQKVKLQFQLNKLRSKLFAEVTQNVSEEISQLKQIATGANNDLIVSAVDAIDSSAISQGVLTPAQLITRFNLLAPELRSAALLPPNAGVLGHLGAKFFSLLLISKSGDVEGKDIESVIARVNNNLVQNRLDDAVEEVANLKGWSRTLADDWLIESRKRLEVEFLVNLIDLESRTLY